MARVRDVAKIVMFIVGGIVAIIVGSFMIRGTMHLWDKPKGEEKDND